MKKVLVIGSGGREHAIVRACLNSKQVQAVIAAPGNGGIARDCPCHPIAVEATEALIALAQTEAVDFVIVGPEAPLNLGLVDAFEAIGIPAYGPRKAGAQLEASKAFTKEFLFKYSIPTAGSQTFTDYDAARAYLKEKDEYPIVIKASGLAAGKGVIIAESYEMAKHAIRAMLKENAFGESGNTVLIEDFLAGEEASITVMCCGEKFVLLPASQDHKRIGEADSGPNTGGMGAYAPAACVTPRLNDEIISTIVEPTLAGLQAEGIDYRGTLYVGIMLTSQGPKVLEFNVRFGDPETQVLLALLESDPIALMYACATGTLEPEEVIIKDAYAMVVVLAAKGYPEKYPKGDPIQLPADREHAWVLHAGTQLTENNTIVSSGGRVLGVVGLGNTLQAAADQAYGLAREVKFTSKYLRHDIGWRQLKRETHP